MIESKDDAVQSVIRMLRVVDSTWSHAMDDVTMEMFVRTIFHDGFQASHATADEHSVGLYGTGGVQVVYDPTDKSTTVSVIAGTYFPAEDDEPETWQ